MKNGRSTCNPTKAEKAWIDTVKRLGCICCIECGYAHDPDGPMVEAHHLLSGGIRRGHLFSLGLCAFHHRRQPIVKGWSLAKHREVLGPSLMDGSVTFHEAFGSDDELMAKQQALLGIAKQAA